MLLFNIMTQVSSKEQIRRFYKGTRRRAINSYKHIAKIEEPVQEIVVKKPVKQTQTEPGIEEELENLFMSVEYLDSKQNKLNNSLVQNFCNLKIEHRLLESDHIELKENHNELIEKYNKLEERLQKIENRLNDPYYGLI